MPASEAHVVSRTMHVRWSHKSAARLFEASDVLRMVSLFLVMLTALHAVLHHQKQYGLAALCIVSIVEAILRLPLSVQEKVMKHQILVIVSMYCVTLFLFLVPMVTVYGAAVLAGAVAAAALTMVVVTEKVA